MKRCLALAITALLLFVPVLGSSMVYAAPANKTVHIGYLESEPYKEFTFELSGLAQGLENLGYLKGLPDLSNEEDAAKVWAQLCKRQSSPTIKFEPQACYSLSELSDSEKEKVAASKDIDLYIVMGTVAGVFLTKGNSSADYMVFASGDPISAGIVKSTTERVNDRSFAHIDQSRYVRQIQAAYNLLKFKDVGVVYQDTPQAYSYSGIVQLEKAAKTFGFTIHTLHVDEPTSPEDYSRYYNELKAAYQKLTPEIDALYITTASIEDEKLPWLLKEVHEAGIYTIAQSSESQVEHGALMNVSINNSREEGLFAAQTIHEYLSGKPITQLEQVFESTPKLALNYDTVRTLKLHLPFQSLLIFDKIYSTGGTQK